MNSVRKGVVASPLWTLSLKRPYSKACDDGILVRQLLHHILSNPATGYFAQEDSAVGGLLEPIAFGFLLGKEGWQAKQAEIYRKLKTSWLTPSELFQPWYGEAVARYVVRHHVRQQTKSPLRIVELGGGRGTFARNFLDHLRQKHPRMYSSCCYTAIEASPVLARHQATLLGDHKCFKVNVGDARQPQAWGPVNMAHSYVLAFEVLDNLPHDKAVRWSLTEPWQEVRVSGFPADNKNGISLPQPRVTASRHCGMDSHDRCVVHTSASSQSVPSLSSAPAAGSSQSLAPTNQLSQETIARVLLASPKDQSDLSSTRAALQEVSVPVRDALIKRCLDAVEWSAAADRGTDVSRTDRGWWGRLLDAFAGVQHIPANAVGGRSEGPDVVYLPTSALQLWDNLHRHRPMHHLIAADFTRFAPEDVLLQGVNAPIVSVTLWDVLHLQRPPHHLIAADFTRFVPEDVLLSGVNAPIVLVMRSGRNIDFDSYLLPPGTADVFFPTHFPSLEALWRESRRQAHGEGSAAKVSSEVLSTAEFMNLYADTKRTKTMTAFNPLVDDFRNTAFFLGSSKV